ncbi:cache domain-containing sensor histidine kinase [Vallitalea okinawensis]|uniref:cache domain-containing sensor histidine kinase n=1 Tax=Vallitalea okinawensis TaxID=2078660 RepID=UPI000CFCE726|nr:histidine kinase [Vallitalea okinawensis]
MEQKKGSTLKYRLTINFLLMLIPVLILGFVSQMITNEAFEDQAINSTSNTINQTAKNIESVIHSVYELYKQVITDEMFRSYLTLDYSQLNDYEKYKLDNEMKDNAISYTAALIDVSSITFITPDGRFIAPASDITNLSEVDKIYETEWCQKAIENKGQFILLGTHQGLDELRIRYKVGRYENYALSLVAYVEDFYTKKGCLIIFDISKDTIRNILKDINLGVNSEIHLISVDGRDIMLDADENIVYTDLDRQFEDQDLINEVYSSEDIAGYTVTQYLEDKYLMVYKKFYNEELILLGLIPEKKLLETSKSIQMTTTILLVVSGIVIILLGVFVFPKKIYNRINKLLIKMRRVEKGDMNIDQDPVEGSDEFAIIDHYFNNMVLKLNNLIQDNYVKQIEKREAELDALQFQINPHFLYNTLASINSMASVRGYHEISEMTEKLGDMFRYSINSSSSEFVGLHEEIKHIQNYIDIENIRFGNKIQLYIDIEDSFLEARVLKFILQPIVENCIKHGFSNPKTEGFIEISVNQEGERLYIIVADDGKGMNSQLVHVYNAYFQGAMKSKKDYKSSIGLKNVNMRIKLAFGDEYGLKISSECGTEVTFCLPYKQATMEQGKRGIKDV